MLYIEIRKRINNMKRPDWLIILLYLLTFITFRPLSSCFESFLLKQDDFPFRRVRNPEEGRISWTPQLFLQKLRDVAARLDTTSSSAFSHNSEGSKVHAAFNYHKEEWGYDDWASAVKATGLEPRTIRWTKELFLGKLRDVAARLDTTSSSAFQDDSEGKKVWATFQNHSWHDSWRDAVIAAGLEPVTPGGQIRWTKELFLEKLRDVATRLETTSSSAFQNDPEGNRVYRAFNYHKEEWGYKNWDIAVEAAGLKPVTPGGQIRWTKELFLEKLRDVAARLETTSSSAFQDDSEGKKVWATFQNHSWHDSWRDAVIAAGLEPIQIRWTKELFLEKLRDVAARLETTSSSAFGDDDPEGKSVYVAFKSHKEWGYDDWASAVKAAGLEPTNFRWTKELFLQKLRDVAIRLGTTSSEAFNNDSEGSRVYRAFRTHKVEWRYENWREAVRAAGL
jgi:hypothetical protein